MSHRERESLRRKRSARALVIFTALLFAGAVPLKADVITPKEAIEIAQGRNPELRSLQEQQEAMSARARQALSPSEPYFSLTYNDTDRFLHLPGAASIVYQIAQPVGFPGKAFVTRSELRDQSKSLGQKLRAKALAIANNVRGAYYNLALALKYLELNQDQKRGLERILEVAKRRYQLGRITQVDLISTQSALYTNLNDLADLKASEKTARAALNLLLGNEPQKEIQIEPLKDVVPKHIDHDAALKKMVENQPEIRAAQYQHQAAEKAYDLARMSLLPDFQVYLGTTYYPVFTATPYAGGTNQLHTYLAGIQLTIPIWGWLNEREGMSQAAHLRATAEANLDLQYLQSKTNLETTLESLKATEFKLQNFQTHLLPLAQKTLDIALESYSLGKVDFQMLSNAATAWRSTKAAYYAMVASYLTSYYSVSQLTGEELD